MLYNLVGFGLVRLEFLPLVGGAAATVLTLDTAVDDNIKGVKDRVAMSRARQCGRDKKLD